VFSQEALAAYSGALSPHPTVISQESAIEVAQSAGIYASPSLGKKGKKGQLPGIGSYGRDHMTDKDWEAKFELLLSEDLIDLPDKLREEHLFFDDPDQMFEIFTELEERNLYLIHRKQEIEQAIEA
jgi:hypothetical protein